MKLMQTTKAAQDIGYTEFVGEPIIFDGFRFPRLPSLFYFADGNPGRRCLFISDESTGVKISFEEGMGCMDETVPSESCIVKHIPSEYRDGDRYLHQIRTDPQTRPGAGNYAFFHMEIPDENGEIHIIPGQMTAPYGYLWSDGAEPILIDMMNGMTVCNTKDCSLQTAEQNKLQREERT